MKVRLEVIAFDAGTQIREALDQHVVTDYADAMTNGAVFPPIMLFHDGNQYYLADGFHRFMAAQRNQFREIEADVQPGTKDDALWFALGANRINGKRLTEADKTHAVALALRMWPNRLHSDVASQIGCSNSLVSKVSSKYTGESGRRIPTGRALQSQEKREAVQTLVKAGGLEREDIASRANVSVGFVSKVRAEMGESSYDRTKEGLVRRRARMRQMAEQGHTSIQIADAVGMSLDGCREALRLEGIPVPADKVTRGTHRHDPNQIVERIVMDAENLTEGVNLVDFSELDRERLGEWADALIAAKKTLDTFIRRLIKEKQKHGQAA